MPDGAAILVVTDHVVLTIVGPREELSIAHHAFAVNVRGAVYVIVNANVGNI